MAEHLPRTLFLTMTLGLAGCFDFTAPNFGSIDDFCRKDGTCNAGLQCDTNNHCTSACAELTCAPYGVCDRHVRPAVCRCDFGILTADGSCAATCQPMSHSTKACSADGKVHWVDSCGGEEDVADDCRTRGCASATCLESSLHGVGGSGAGTGTEPYAVQLNSLNQPVVCIAEGGQIVIETWDGQQWQPLHEVNSPYRPYLARSSLSSLRDPRLKLGNADAPYCTWLEGSDDTSLSVRGTTWNTQYGWYYLGNIGGVTPVGVQPPYGFTLGAAAAPTIVWNDSGNAPHAMQYSETTLQWSALPDPPTQISAFTGDAGELIAAGGDADRFDFSEQTWTSIAGAVDAPQSLFPSGAGIVHCVDKSGANVVAAYTVLVGGVNRLFAARYGGDRTWVALGSEGASEATRNVAHAAIAVNSRGDIVLAHTDSDQPNSAESLLMLKKFRDGAWVEFAPGSASGNGVAGAGRLITKVVLGVGEEQACVSWQSAATGGSSYLSAMLCGPL